MSLENEISRLIKEKGKARIWFDFVLEKMESELEEGTIIVSPYSSLPIGSVDIMFAYNKKNRKMINLARILRCGYYDFFDDKDIEEQMSKAFKEKKEKAKTFKRYKEFYLKKKELECEQ